MDTTPGFGPIQYHHGMNRPKSKVGRQDNQKKPAFVKPAFSFIHLL
jgi:hypothetical protein